MTKKIVSGVAAAGTALALLPLFAAFEAHVVNVTAKIENALTVPLTPLDFGTVFPQEHLDLPLSVALSESFLDEERVETVEYFIRQKPKCGVTENDGEDLVGPTWTGHVVVTGEAPNFSYFVDCEQDRPENVPESPLIGEVPNQVVDVDYYLLPSLCEYISKHPDLDQLEGGNDGSLNSFHQPFEINENGEVVWNDTDGVLVKEDDEEDIWNIDLAVPCFGNHCAQDWLEFVRDITGEEDMTLEEANEYTQPITNEHKIFGCNLWVEVSDVDDTDGSLQP